MNHRAKICLLIAVAALTLVLLAVGAKAWLDRSTYYANCSVARAHHDTNIPKSSPFYRAALDKDNDGYACED